MERNTKTGTTDTIGTYRRIWRKKKVWNTESFVEQQSAEVKQIEDAKRRDSGLYCKGCKARRSWARLRTQYEKQGTDWIRLWICDQCNVMLREDNLDERGV